MSRDPLAPIAAAILILVAAAAPAAAASPRVQLADPPASAAPGATVALSATATRPGKLRSLRLVLVLSRDAKAGAGDLRLPRALVLRRQGRRLRGTVRVPVPAGATGTYRLLACRSSRPLRRCVLARRALRVQAPPRPAAPVAPAAPQPAAPPSPPAPPRPATIYDQPANPLSVTVREGAGAAQTKTVRPDGGQTLSVTAGGRAVTLEVPPGAVLSPVAITLRPLDGVDGLPFAQAPLAAVRTEPAGLRLLKPATLRVADVASLGATRLTGLAFRPDGTEVHLLPSRPGDPAELTINRLGGHGVADTTPAERDAVAGRLPSDRVDRLLHLVALALGRPPAAALRTARVRAAAQDPAVAHLQEFYDLFLDPLLSEAASDPAKLPQAIAEYAAWTAQVLVLPAAQAFFVAERDSADRRLRLGLINAYRTAGSRCEGGSPVFPQLVLIGQAHATLIAFGFAYDADDLAASRLKCLKLELDVTIASSGTIDAGIIDPDGDKGATQTWSGTMTVKDVPLESSDGVTLSGGGGTVLDGSYTVAPRDGSAGCTRTDDGTAGPSLTASLDLALNLGSGVTAYDLRLRFGQPAHAQNCGAGAAGTGLLRCVSEDVPCPGDLALEQVQGGGYRTTLAGAIDPSGGTFSRSGTWGAGAPSCVPADEFSGCQYKRVDFGLSVDAVLG
jgi:hypothetical protein